MRRIVIALMSTISGLVLLFSYHTSTNSGSVSLVAAGTSGGLTGGKSNGSVGAPSPSPSRAAAPSPAAPAAPAPSRAAPSTVAKSPAAPSPAAPSPVTKAPVPTKPSGTFTGDPADTRWGIVQVQIVVQSGKITGSDVVQVPQDNQRDVEINQVAVPILNQAVLDNQSASFDGVSGATVTSDGYKQSLQSALDQAHL